MKVGVCFKDSCLYKNESESAYCSRIDCPLMEKGADGETKSELVEANEVRGGVESASSGGRR